jgi:PhnB protein
MQHPEYYLPVMPYIIVNNAEDFISFIKTVFGAEERLIVPRDNGQVMHAEFSIEKATIMFAHATEDYKPFPCGMFILLNDLDTVYQKGLQNGGVSLQEPGDRDYGKSAGFQDPFGNQWWLVEN